MKVGKRKPTSTATVKLSLIYFLWAFLSVLLQLKYLQNTKRLKCIYMVNLLYQFIGCSGNASGIEPFSSRLLSLIMIIPEMVTYYKFNHWRNVRSLLYLMGVQRKLLQQTKQSYSMRKKDEKQILPYPQYILMALTNLFFHNFFLLLFSVFKVIISIVLIARSVE